MTLALASVFFACYLGANLLAAGIAHWLDKPAFVVVLRSHRLLGGRTTQAVGHLLAPIELTVGALLVASLVEPAVSAPAAFLSLALSLAMAVYIYVLLRAGYSGDCGCGLADGRLGPHTMARTLSLLLSSIALVFVTPHAATVRILSAAEFVAGAGAGIAMALVAAMACKAWALAQGLESEVLLEHRVMP